MMKVNPTSEQAALGSWAMAITMLIMMIGCSDPADSVPEATVTEAESNLDRGNVAGTQYVIRSSSTIGFVASKVTRSHHGGFKNFEGVLKVNDGKLVGEQKIVINMNSAWTDTDRLTGHLKSADFFDVAAYPTSTFILSRIVPSGGRFMVSGNLNLHGVTKHISFPATIDIGDAKATVKASFSINRRDFSISFPGMPDDLIRDKVVISLEVVATPGLPNPEDQLSFAEFKDHRGGAGVRGGPGRGHFVESVMANDANGDGKVSEDELPVQMRRMMGRLDSNGDGFVEKAEIEAARQRFQRAGQSR